MATKWKNRLKVIGWLLLLTFGLSGVMSGLLHSSEFAKKDYFQTDQFDYQMNDFIYYLSMFELNSLTKEEAKERITVTAEEINEHRYRYGDLADQMSTIKGQYEGDIQSALLADDEELANTYRAERDEKIEDITNNFRSDEHVEAKVIREKEQRIDEHYDEIEQFRSDFLKYKNVFKYYLEDISTGDIYTNLTINTDDINNVFNKGEMMFIREYSASLNGYLDGQQTMHMSDATMLNNEESATEGLFEGVIAIPKSASVTSPVVRDYYEFQQKQIILLIYFLSGSIAYFTGLLLFKRMSIRQAMDLDKWQAYYERIPIDVRGGMLLLTTLFTLITLKLLGELPLLYSQNALTMIDDVIIYLLLSTILMALTFIQAIYAWVSIKEWQTHWPKALSVRAYQAVTQAFSNRRIGTQVIILIMTIYAFGVGSIAMLMNPLFLIIYVLAFLVVGLPILTVIIKRIGYFNHIVHYAENVVNGRYDSDLPVKGKAVLADLASYINTMKQGVMSSQKEQAKSERLKTELITNVSHDLRTPLTSIITYTELLKTAESKEDREAYIQVIDRKSKRLKILIDDLFEASKMASGNIELVKERADIVQLLQQTLAEHNEMISQSTLQFRVTNSEAPVYAIVDGQKLWRVFDNLIRNILYYTLENTRVYLSVKKIDEKVVITFKNVTKYELGDDSDELFERFKRGDASRHTEGSGLGLAIAKSIVDLHGGRLDIDVDGDLFKVTVTLNGISS